MLLDIVPSGEIDCFGFCGGTLETFGSGVKGGDFGGVGLNVVRDESCWICCWNGAAGGEELVFLSEEDPENGFLKTFSNLLLALFFKPVVGSNRL